MVSLVGILNLTPDSFSDGGKYETKESAISQAEKLIKDGAKIIDIGAESTRPGATPLSPEEEWQRLENTIGGIIELAGKHGVTTSLDTRHPENAKKAIELGIDWINDVSGFTNDEMIKTVENTRARLVVMHNLGIPADKAITLPENTCAITEVKNWAETRILHLEQAGINKDRIIFDPGIGFGKTPVQSWELINKIAAFKSLGVELFVGHSRKSFIGGNAHERDAKTLEISKQLAKDGVDYLRVHDIAAHKELI